MGRSVASPGTSRRDSGEATPRRILLELPPEPSDGARVLLIDGSVDLRPADQGALRYRVVPGDFGPVLDSLAPSVLPPGPRSAPGATGPMLPEEILAASGRPGEPRPTPRMSALDWVRVFGPLGSEDRGEGEPDAPTWARDRSAPVAPAGLPPDESAEAPRGVTEMSLMALLDELAPAPSRSAATPSSATRSTATRSTAARPSPARAGCRDTHPRRRSRSRRRWLPLTAAAVAVVPSAAVLGALLLDRPASSPVTPDAGQATPTGTTTSPTAD